jgi:hypothetical protein
MRRSVIAGTVLTVGTVLGVLTPVAGSTAAWAGGPQHVRSTSSGEETVPAGQLCDFTYHNEFTLTTNAVIFPDGREIDQDVINATHTNVDTGFTLTETDYFSLQFSVGQVKEAGIQWHLRTADGKLIVVHAGQLVFSPAGDVLSFTPNINPDFGAVICPALGGHPAS